ncbi:CHAT domain-containing protein [Spirulina major CS-329]|uniref:CHAT domain-containing protein n=1 Tax=Spirulina TaxID=1154 RepID=UPI00232F2724|nr:MULTISPECIES: CHAT domain-containing protein [Spirulina]MDB9493803.1 CHAT domain-containing protein [Spirulina subsalsa CS-330]MDB9505385.1 CHAT domain-containing protein [Spirulina major CS-329]
MIYRSSRVHQRALRWLALAGVGLLVVLGLQGPMAAQSLDRLPAAPSLWAQAQEQPIAPIASLDHLERQLAAAIAQGDRVAQAQTLNHLAQAYRTAGDFRQAQDAIAQSLALFPALKQPRLYAQALTIQASLERDRGAYSAAQGYWEQAVRLYDQAGDREGVQGTRLNQISTLAAMGNVRRACGLAIAQFEVGDGLTQCDQIAALTDAEFALLRDRLATQLHHPLAAQLLTRFAATLQYTGRLERSRQLLDLSLSTLDPQQQPTATAMAHLVLGNIHRSLEQPDEAIAQYQTAADLAAPIASSSLWLDAQINQTRLLLDQQQLPAARTLAAAILHRFQAEPLTHRTLIARLVFAQQWLAVPNSSPPVDRATLAQFIADSIQAARQRGDRTAEAYGLGILGSAYAQTQQTDTAIQLTREALTLARPLQSPELIYPWEWQLTQLLETQGDLNGAIAANERAVASLERLEHELVSSNRDSQFSFRESVEPIYRNLVSLLLTPNRDRTKGETKADNNSSTIAQANLRRARQVIENLQVAELNDFFRTPCISARTTEIDQIINQGDRSTAVLYPILLNDRLTVILSLPGDDPQGDALLRYHTTGVNPNTIARVVEQLRRTLAGNLPESRIYAPAQTLYEWLIAPFEADLQGHQIETLTFVLDGPLRRLPMAVLFDGEQYLIEKYNLAITPGLQLVPPRSLQSVELSPLVAGLSEARHGFEAIPAVVDEVKHIRDSFPNSKLLFNESFTTANLVEAIQTNPFPIVHLATHGEFNATPTDTFLLTWDNEINANEFSQVLQSRDLQQNSPPIELLILSACQTALGDDRAALGLAGLAVRSGARSTIASLWSVSDESTGLMMQELYQILLHSPEQDTLKRAEVLRRAQLSLLQSDDFHHPFFWAPFILIGSWL